MERSTRPYLVIIQGAPGVGKTTIAHHLSKELDLPCISKDGIKEALYDTLGLPSSMEDTKLYGRIAIRSMYAAADEYLKLGRSVMIEAPLEAEFAVGDIADIISSEQVVQLYVFCDPDEQVRRFRQRIAEGERHPGHIDTLSFSREDALKMQQRNQQLPGFVTVSVDTTQFDEADQRALSIKVKEALV